jgi:membrane-associated phospholipid phosphatase
MFETMFPVERFVVRVCAVLCLINIVLIAASRVVVDWLIVGGAFALLSMILAGGHVYRHTGRDARIGLALTGAGLFTLASLATGMLSYLLVPFVGDRIDPWLIRVDGQLGFDWPSFVEWMSHHPTVTQALAPVYASSLPQLVLVVLVLGFGGRTALLHRFLLTGMVGALGTILVWAVLPSSGPSAFLELPAGVLERVRLVVEPSYGAELNRLMNDGALSIPPRQVLGLIGFPSFHTVMAFMAVWFIPRRSLLFWPVLVVNVAMAPAILLHGGHHLVDVLGGIAMFFVALHIAVRAADRLERDRRTVPGAAVAVIRAAAE